jgi:rSAM/selenodomain-associated transferase 2
MHSIPPLSVVIPVLDGAALLAPCIAALAEGQEHGLIGEVIVVDGGSRDGSQERALVLGARLLSRPAGRGGQLAAGGEVATGAWLLFLHVDTRLSPGWSIPVTAFLAAPENRTRAAYFRLRLDDAGRLPRWLEAGVALRCRWLGLPYGDQGLLLAQTFYRSLGGFRPLPLMEDVDLARRIGRHRLVGLDVVATSSAARYRRDGYGARILRNLACLALYYLGLPPRLIRRIYA